MRCHCCGKEDGWPLCRACNEAAEKEGCFVEGDKVTFATARRLPAFARERADIKRKIRTINPRALQGCQDASIECLEYILELVGEDDD